MKENKTSKVKEFLVKNEKDIKGEMLRIGYWSLGIVIGYYVGFKKCERGYIEGIRRHIQVKPELETLLDEAHELLLTTSTTHV